MRVHRRYVPTGLLLVGIVLIGLAFRAALWHALPRAGFIGDEAEYLAAADWLANGRGFSWHQQWLWTRAPLYPLFLAAHLALFGVQTTPIYITQTVLSLINVVLVFFIGTRVSNYTNGKTYRSRWRVPLWGALLSAIYLPFATYPSMLLSETLYTTLLLSLVVLLGMWSRCARQHIAPAWFLLAGAGIVVGFATLTRGLTQTFLPFIIAWVWYEQHLSHQKTSHKRWRILFAPRTVVAPTLIILTTLLTIAPWSYYASKLYGGFILIDTTGGYNVMLGAHNASDEGGGYQAAQQFVLALLDARLTAEERHAYVAASCLATTHHAALQRALARPAERITQAERQQLMVSEAFCVIAHHPSQFVAKSATEFIRFFQINYTGAERMTSGFTLGKLPRWYTLALFLLEDTLYVCMVPLAIVGWVRHRHAPLSALIGLLLLAMMLTAPLLFAINRFRMPMMPFLCIYAPLVFVSPTNNTTPTPHITARCVSSQLITWVTGAAALLVTVIITTPYAYVQSAPSSWASYLGPYPSSVANSIIAWQTRPNGMHDEQVIAALREGNAPAVRTLLAQHDITPHSRTIVEPLLAGLEGHPAAGIALLPDSATMEAHHDWRAAVVRGHLLRQMGNEAGAKAAFTPMYVDDANPVAWAWHWLAPPPARRIDLAGNLDVGYINGFYLGEGDPSANGTFRWAARQAWLRFPAQGTGTPQTVCLRVDGRGFPTDLPVPTTRLLIFPEKNQSPDNGTVYDDNWQTTGSGQLVTTFVWQRDIAVYCATLPSVPRGEDITLMLHTKPPFVPNALDLVGQRGEQTGQLRLLGIRVDWAELQ